MNSKKGPIVAIIVLVIIAGIVYFASNKKSEAPTQEQGSNQVTQNQSVTTKPSTGTVIKGNTGTDYTPKPSAVQPATVNPTSAAETLKIFNQVGTWKYYVNNDLGLVLKYPANVTFVERDVLPAESGLSTNAHVITLGVPFLASYKAWTTKQFVVTVTKGESCAYKSAAGTYYIAGRTYKFQDVPAYTSTTGVARGKIFVGNTGNLCYVFEEKLSGPGPMLAEQTQSAFLTSEIKILDDIMSGVTISEVSVVPNSLK